MFSGRALSVVVISEDDPGDASGLVLPGNVWDSAALSSGEVAHIVHFIVFRVDSGDEEVVGNVVQVAAEFEPGAGSGNVIGRALALDLDKDLGVFQLFSIPNGEGREELEVG